MTGAPYGGYVLAGGRSSRMGTDKALLTIHGATLLERVTRAVIDAVGSAVIVGGPAGYARFGIPMIADSYHGAGPLGGIHAALTHSAADWNLVAACDMPGLDGAGLRRLVEETRHRDVDVVLPEAGGRLHPLCAVYRRSCLRAIQEALLDGRYRILDAMASLRVIRLAVHEEALFHNVNTPEDWKRLTAL